jgi:tetratricopeptide (TPR) repeat protein
MTAALLMGGLLAGSDAFAGGRGGDDYSRATELHGDGRYDEAAARFIASYEAGYREETSAYNAACALARAGKKDDAFRWLEKAYDAGFELEEYLDEDRDLRSLRSDPRFAALEAKVQRGHTSRRTREGERVVQRFQALRAQDDAKAHLYDDVGRELLGVGRYDEAARAFTTAATRGDHPGTSLYNAACARSLQGDKTAALALLQRAVEDGFADPKHLDEDDDLDNIRDDPRFKQIHALAEELDTPAFPSQSSERRGESQRQWQAALPRIEAATRNHPQIGQAWFNLGLARLVVGQPAQAVAPFEKAVDLGYRKSTSMYNLACAHALAGHKDEAFAWLDKAFANGFDGSWLIRQDADLDDIRYDPRFRKYLELARVHEREQHD